MRYKAKFRPNQDFFEVVGGLAIDLEEAVRTGMVGDTGVDLEYNNLDEPEQIGDRVSDVFESLEAQKTIFNRERARQMTNKGGDDNGTTSSGVGESS